MNSAGSSDDSEMEGIVDCGADGDGDRQRCAALNSAADQHRPRLAVKDPEVLDSTDDVAGDPDGLVSGPLDVLGAGHVHGDLGKGDGSVEVADGVVEPSITAGFDRQGWSRITKAFRSAAVLRRASIASASRGDDDDPGRALAQCLICPFNPAGCAADRAHVGVVLHEVRALRAVMRPPR